MKKILLLIVAILATLSCEREEDFVLAGPTLIPLADGPAESTQEPGNEVYLQFTLQAASGLSNFTVLKDGELYDELLFIDEVSASYIFSYPIPANTPLGTQTDFTFTLTDKEGREVVYNYRLKIDATFIQVNEVVNGTPVIRVKGRLNNSFTMEAATTYVIDSTFSVENNSTLTIEQGSTVYFKTYTQQNLSSRLVIARGSKLEAEGTATQPIVFTSDKLLMGQQGEPTDWGGVYIYGSSPVNQGAEVLEEGFRYGGTMSTQNCGTLKYLRIEYAGKNEAHALHLFGVGSGTTVEHVQVWQNENIAFRVKGGTVNLKYIAGIGHGGYGIWAEHGWQGNGQFWIFQTNRQATLVPANFWNQARSIEMRNDENFYLNTPRTTFNIANITLIGNGNQAGNGTRRGIRVRRGAVGKIQNAIVAQFPDEGVRVEDLDVEELGNAMVLSNMRAFNNAINYEQEVESFFLEDAQYNVTETAIGSITQTNFVGSETSTFNPSTMGSFFVSAPYIGAVESDANDWTAIGNWFKNLDGTIR